MPLTWTRAVESSLLGLSDDLASVEVVHNAFERIAPEWADAQADVALPFASGITSDNVPVEVSVQRSVKHASLRLIAQPYRSCPPAELLAFMRERALTYVTDQAGTAAGAIVTRVLEIFPDE